MSLVFTGLTVCSVAGVLKGKVLWMLLTMVFGALAVLLEMKENRG